MKQVAEMSDLGLHQYMSVILRRWRVVVVATVLGLLAAAGYLSTVPTTATARTDVNIDVISTDPFNATKSASGLLDGTTEAQIAGSHAVAALASKSLGGAIAPGTLRKHADVSTVSDATVLRVAYTAPTEAEALQGADAMAAAYLSYRATQAQARLSGMIDRISASLEELRSQLADANGRAANASPGSIEANQAASDRDLVTIEIDSLIEQKNDLAQIDTSGGSILTPATENTVQFGPQSTILLASGLMGGFVLGILLAFPADRLNRRLRRRTDVELATGAPMLVQMRTVAAVLPAGGAELDALRVARERILAALPDSARVLTVLDDTSTSAVSDVPVDLASAIAQDGRKVLLVVSGLPLDVMTHLREVMNLRVIEEEVGGVLYGSGRPETLQVYLALPGADHEADSVVTTSVRTRVRSTEPDRLVVLALPVAAGAASRLAAQRLADAAVLVVERRVSRAHAVSAHVKAFEDAGVLVIGSIMVPRGRRILTPRAPAEQPNRRVRAFARPDVVMRPEDAAPPPGPGGSGPGVMFPASGSRDLARSGGSVEYAPAADGEGADGPHHAAPERSERQEAPPLEADALVEGDKSVKGPVPEGGQRPDRDEDSDAVEIPEGAPGRVDENPARQPPDSGGPGSPASTRPLSLAARDPHGASPR